MEIGVFFFFGDFDSRRERVSERLLRTNTDDARKAHPLHSENTHTHTHSLMLEVTRVICLPSLSKGTKKKNNNNNNKLTVEHQTLLHIPVLSALPPPKNTHLFNEK